MSFMQLPYHPQLYYIAALETSLQVSDKEWYIHPM